jgi:streptomycin 6-kinase
MSLTLPDGVLGMAERGEDWAAWVHGLPRLAEELMSTWDLELDGLPMHGFCALVLPVAGPEGDTVLKISFPEEETEQEHLALGRWDGCGAVRLLRADPRRRAMLLERLAHDKLDSIDVDTACEVVAGLYAQLHVPASGQYRRLSTWTRRWRERLAALPSEAPVPRRLVVQATSLARELAEDPDTDGTLVHGDLHYLNVLAGERQPWLAIDPKPLSGDPHLEPAPMLWNRWDEAVATGDARSEVRHRFHTLVDVAGLDEDRARAWTVLRLVVLAVEQWQEALDVRGPGRSQVIEATTELVTAAVTVAKAVQAE